MQYIVDTKFTRNQGIFNSERETVNHFKSLVDKGVYDASISDVCGNQYQCRVDTDSLTFETKLFKK